jgi:outer membrane biosynthesis protein TonB
MADYAVPQGREMSQLRQEAIRRAREMQARAQIPVNYQPPKHEPEPPPPEPEPEPSPPEPTPEPRHEMPSQNNPQPQNIPHPRVQQMPIRQRQNSGQNRRPELLADQSLGGALDFLTKDPERAIILVLLLILMEEKADNSLLFAMMYLLA